MRRWLRTTVLLAALLAATGCGGSDDLEVTAVFDDVGDLVPRAAVTVADVQIGSVAEIGRTPDQQALVRLRIDDGVDLPADVRARLRRTSLLGERFVELVPVDSGSGPRLAHGDRIDDTVVVPDLEEALLSGADVVAAVSADRLASGLEGAAVALSGRGDTLHGLLGDMATVTGAYAGRSEDLVAIVDDVEAFLADVGPQAALHGVALEELRRAASGLDAQDDRLLDALQEMQALSVTGTDLLRTHRGTLDSTLRSLQGILAEVEARDEDLAQLFSLLAQHNDMTIRGVNAEHIQVFADVIMCGHNDDPGDPVRACDAPPQGTQRPAPGRPR